MARNDHGTLPLEFSLALASSLVRCGDLEPARSLLSLIVQQQPDAQPTSEFYRARLQLASILVEARQWEMAATHYDYLLDNEEWFDSIEEQVRTWLAAAYVYAQTNRGHEAIALRRRALHTTRAALHGPSGALHRPGGALHRLGGALHRPGGALSTSGDLPSRTLWIPYLQAFVSTDDIAKADDLIVQQIYQTYTQDQRTRSQDDEFLRLLSDGLAKLGQYQMAAEVREPIATDADQWYRYASLLAQADRHVEALKYYEQVLAAGIVPEDSARYDELQLALASTEQHAGDSQRAEERYAQVAAKYRPQVGHEQASLQAWRFYLQAVRGLEALSPDDRRLIVSAQRDLQRFADDEPLAEALCDITLRTADDGEACIAFVGQAMERFPDSISIRVLHARALVHAGRLSEADAVLTRLHRDVQPFSAELSDASSAESLAARGRWASPTALGEITLLHGRVKAKLSDYAAAVRLFESTPQLQSMDPAEYAAALANAEQVDKAIEVLENSDRLHADAQAFLASLYVRQKQFDKAQTTIEMLLAQNPDDHDIRRQLANTLFWARDYERAIEQYESLLELYPADHELRVSLAKSLLWIGRYDAAAERLSDLVVEDVSNTELWIPTLDALAGSEKSSLQNPSLLAIRDGYSHTPLVMQHEVVVRLSRIYRRAREPMLARKILLPYVDAPGASPHLRVEYADVLAALKSYGQAIGIYEDVLADLQRTSVVEQTSASSSQTRPPSLNEQEIRLRFADVLHQAKQYQSSQQQLDRLWEELDEQAPARLAHAYLSTARNLVALRRHQEALEYFERLRSIDPGSFDLHEEYAGALLSASRPREALDWINRAEHLSLAGEYLLGAIYSNLESFDRAVHVYTSIVKRVPEELRAWRLLADNASWDKDYPTGIHIYKQLLVRSPGDESLRIALADAYLWSGEKRLAFEIYYSILSQSPDRYDLWANFVRSATSDLSIPESAEKLLSSIVATRQNWPTNFDFRVSMVDALVRLGNDREAISLLRELLEVQPDNRNLRRRLADELHRLQHYEEAEQIYRQLLHENQAIPRRTTPKALRTRVVSGTLRP